MTHCTTPLEGRILEGVGKRTASRNKQMGSGETTPNKTKQNTGKALAFLNHLKPLMNLCRALMLTLDTEFKKSKKLLRGFLNLLLLAMIEVAVVVESSFNNALIGKFLLPSN